MHNIYFNHVEAFKIKCYKKGSNSSNENFIIGIWNVISLTNIVVLGQLGHKLKDFQLCQKN